LCGVDMIFFFDAVYSLKGMRWHERIVVSLFPSVSSRSGGLRTCDITEFSGATDLLISGLMFIGASPSSVGGGIRTTTLAIAILFLVNFAKGRHFIHVFNRRIKLVDVYRSYAVILVAGFMVVAALILLSVTEPTISTHALLFEITSAFGTCGMSLGITSSLSITGKIVIMLLMFIGRVGLISFLLSLGGR